MPVLEHPVGLVDRDAGGVEEDHDRLEDVEHGFLSILSRALFVAALEGLTKSPVLASIDHAIGRGGAERFDVAVGLREARLVVSLHLIEGCAQCRLGALGLGELFDTPDELIVAIVMDAGEDDDGR